MAAKRRRNGGRSDQTVGLGARIAEPPSAVTPAPRRLLGEHRVGSVSTPDLLTVCVDQVEGDEANDSLGSEVTSRVSTSYTFVPADVPSVTLTAEVNAAVDGHPENNALMALVKVR